MPNLISIEVTADIAYKIRLMAEAGLFSIRTGNAQLNFHEGNLKSIKTEYVHHYPQLQAEVSIDIPVVSPILK